MTATVRYLSSAEVRALMPPMKEVIDLVEETLRLHGKGGTQLPAKIDLHPKDDAFLHAMPALVEAQRACGMKWVAGFPQNPGKGLPYIHGTLVLNDPDTGVPLAIMDAGAITAARTGACTAVTAKHLADPNSEVLTILGCGAQGRSNIEALLTVFPEAERMLAFDTHAERQAQFADWVMTTFDLASIIPPEPREAVEGGHVVVTAGPIRRQPEPVIEPDWIQTGTLCVALDFDSYFTKAAFERADLYVTDDLKQYAHFQGEGYFAGLPEPAGDLGQICAGKGPERPEGEPVVIAANLGLGILDVALGNLVLQRAAEQGTGTELAL